MKYKDNIIKKYYFLFLFSSLFSSAGWGCVSSVKFSSFRGFFSFCLSMGHPQTHHSVFIYLIQCFRGDRVLAALALHSLPHLLPPNTASTASTI
jgi:hypothetical protein